MGKDLGTQERGFNREYGCHCLDKSELNEVLLELPTIALVLMKDYRLYLGGGFIRAILNKEEPKDIDLFMSHHEVNMDNLSNLMSNYGYSKLSTDNAITFKRPCSLDIQIITRWTYRNPCDMIDSFDYTIAQAGVYYNEPYECFSSVVSPQYHEDVLNKRLRYTHVTREEEVAGSFLRMLKFLKNGYKTDDISLASVVARASGSEPETVMNNIGKVRTRSNSSCSGIY